MTTVTKTFISATYNVPTRLGSKQSEEHTECRGLGRFKEDPELLKKAMEYIRRG